MFSYPEVSILMLRVSNTAIYNDESFVSYLSKNVNFKTFVRVLLFLCTVENGYCFYHVYTTLSNFGESIITE